MGVPAGVRCDVQATQALGGGEGDAEEKGCGSPRHCHVAIC